MAINALRGRRSRTVDGGNLEDLPIGGDASPDVFACPVCARPLAMGTNRCGGCRTFLLLGTPARRASLFVALGIVLGLVGGAALAGAAASSLRLAPSGSSTPVAIVRSSPSTADGQTGIGSGTGPATTTNAPTDGPAASSRGTGSAGIPAVPVAAASALRLTFVVDDRLQASTDHLRAALRGSFDPVEVAATLRGIAGDAAWGTDVVGRLSDWPAATTVQTSLRDHYAAVAAAARDGLGATITSAPAYRIAALRMVALADRLPALRAAAADLAIANGLAAPAATR